MIRFAFKCTAKRREQHSTKDAEMKSTREASKALLNYKKGIGENIRKIRRSRGWSVDKLRSEIIGKGVTFASSTLVCWENGSRGVQTHVLPVIAAALKCNVTRILPESPRCFTGG